MSARGQSSSASRRQQQMAEFALAQGGSASFPQLAKRFGVSQMTAYRDADRLAELGVVRRVRGGITAQPSSIFESSLKYRANVFRDEKEAISKACLELVEPEMSIIIDDGSTLMPLVRRLRTRTPLTVVTTFVPVIEELSEVPGINLLVLGGFYRRLSDSMGGILCVDMINQIRADVLFLCPSAINAGTALHQEEDMIATKRAMMRSSDRKVLVADHSKLGRRATHKLAPVEDFETIITDDNADREALSHILDYGTPVNLVATGQ